MSRYWSAVVRGLTPYVPGEQPKLANLVKLNTNENPYPPVALGLAAMQANWPRRGERQPAPLPGPERRPLKAIAHHFAAKALPRQQVFVGNGSDEVLAHAFMALLKHERPILFPDITYSFYPVYCGLYGVEHAPSRLTSASNSRVDDYSAQRRHHLPQPERPDRPSAAASS
jgi:histidinol-phosphate aminotransferase